VTRRGPRPAKRKTAIAARSAATYDALVGGIAGLLEEARRTSARAVNALMTATYWEIGRRIVKHEQSGRERAGYGEALLKRLAADPTARFGRGIGGDDLQRFRRLYLAWPRQEICATLSHESGGGGEREKSATPSRRSPMPDFRQTPSGKSAATNIPALPGEKVIPAELDQTRRTLEARRGARGRAVARKRDTGMEGA